MPNVEVNPTIPDDQLQLKILKIEKLKLPEVFPLYYENVTANLGLEANRLLPFCRL